MPFGNAYLRCRRSAVWLARTSVHRRFDVVVYGATPLGEALCCDGTLAAKSLLLLLKTFPEPTWSAVGKLLHQFS